ncbi:Kazal-type serine protease inhibitor domain-containing protein [Nocardia sp. alder85J]|uniref:Kazal-type serine protease inhibitor domain-containing protein n=1 Tax=Nocardia sp. alder85J TaxID=2862949 RepID=UPI001CD577BF|nr:Kazal-type serine protease inhibitor domain-containing protein [Nocardia sp. alder85J]MCX4094891.1 Kazal-type serine protease inhibitor domain-containing protein [Nocardia sp. alder85J]
MRSARLLVAVLPALVVAAVLTVLTAAPTVGAPPTPFRAAPSCPSRYAPVCGADGIDYRNTCEAKRLRVQIRHDGPCTVTERSGRR